MLCVKYDVKTSDGLARLGFRTLHQAESWMGEKLFVNGKVRKAADGTPISGLVEKLVSDRPDEDIQKFGFLLCKDELCERLVFAKKYESFFETDKWDSRVKYARVRVVQ